MMDRLIHHRDIAFQTLLKFGGAVQGLGRGHTSEELWRPPFRETRLWINSLGQWSSRIEGFKGRGTRLSYRESENSALGGYFINVLKVNFKSKSRICNTQLKSSRWFSLKFLTISKLSEFMGSRVFWGEKWEINSQWAWCMSRPPTPRFNLLRCSLFPPVTLVSKTTHSVATKGKYLCICRILTRDPCSPGSENIVGETRNSDDKGEREWTQVGSVRTPLQKSELKQIFLIDKICWQRRQFYLTHAECHSLYKGCYGNWHESAAS